jgi:3-oxoacyl-[acyl-carrier protein] reductase
MRLDGRVIIVTGGSRGIGRACVLHAVALGAHVVFCSRTDGRESRDVEASATAIASVDAACGIRADVSIEADVRRLFARAEDMVGDLHGVVGNAAVLHDRLLASTATDEWDAAIDVDLTGGFLVAREALRAFLERGRGGRIVTIGTLSQNGVSGNIGYAAAKAGLEAFTRSVAHRYAGDGIAANIVVPGYVETALSARMSDASRRALIDGAPMRRAGSADEIASVVAWLLSDDAAGVSGRTLHAAGGLREVPA